MRFGALLVGSLLGSLVVALACGAPDGVASCEAYCDQRAVCAAEETEGECLWQCLGRVERAGEQGSKCSRRMREEISCLGGVTDCEVVLDDRLGRDDPCFSEAETREGVCGEDF